MVDLQSPLMAAVKTEKMGGDIDELLAELQRERQKNALLLDRISVLEAQIQHINPVQGSCPATAEGGSRERVKRQKIESTPDKLGTINGSESRSLSPSKPQHDGLVSWMSMDDMRFPPLDKCKNVESTLHCEDTDDTNDDDDDDDPCSDDDTDSFVNMTVMNDNKLENATDVYCMNQNVEAKKNVKLKNLSFQKKPTKVAFCPKEVRGMLDSSVLALKNAQSHTMRKIIVFASLGIRHGCEEMYELDYNHFSILGRGEPYVSPNNLGEHVLYENPGLKKKKVLYPNHHNPALCPVQILEEEKTMRPSDTSCPSCLFLCIKYGGKTRNVPQNEYVRQRMGRNKLKSFGPLMCQMARLVNVRTGSFFFKALGITLLFMAGFPDDIVQRETKYRNFDLLQKYYRTDEDAAGEELFHTNDSCSDLASYAVQKQNSKTTTKSKGKKQTNSANKANPQNPPQATATTSEAPTTQFGLVGYTSTQTPVKETTTFPHTLTNIPSISTQTSNPTFMNSRPNIPYNPHNLHPMFPPHPANAMFPLMYWPSPHNAYATWPPYHASPYGYRAVSATNGGHYVSIHPQPYYGQGLGACGTVFVAKPEEESRNRIDHHSDEAAISGSESSSSSREPK